MAKVAVAVLIVIAIAGFVLAGLKSRSAAPGAAAAPDATQEGASAPTAAAASSASVAADDGAGPNRVVFVPASDQLTDSAKAKLQRLAEKARDEHRTIAIVADVESRADRAEQMALARSRAYAVRQVLEANGVALAAMRIEIAELPAGTLSPIDANRIELALR